MSGTYHTRQKDIIVSCLTANPGQSLSAKEIHALCKTDGVPVGLATIYRRLTALVEESRARKIITNHGKSIRFQYMDAPADAFYLKCDCCGRAIPADCAFLDRTKTHISAEHGFEIDVTKSILYGRCKACK